MADGEHLPCRNPDPKINLQTRLAVLEEKVGAATKRAATVSATVAVILSTILSIVLNVILWLRGVPLPKVGP